MRKSKFTESQIVAILAEGESGLAVGDVCRKKYSHLTTVRSPTDLKEPLSDYWLLRDSVKI